NKAVYGLGGDDKIFLEMHQGKAYGGAGDDRLVGGEEQWGGDGDDSLEHALGEVIQRGGEGDDSILPGSGFAVIDGNTGDDTVKLPSPVLETRFRGMKQVQCLSVTLEVETIDIFHKLLYHCYDCRPKVTFSSPDVVAKFNQDKLKTWLGEYPYLFEVDLSKQTFTNRLIELFKQQGNDFSILKDLYDLSKGSLRVKGKDKDNKEVDINFINYAGGPTAFLVHDYSDLKACKGKTYTSRSDSGCPDDEDVVPFSEELDAATFDKIPKSELYKVGDVVIGILSRKKVKHYSGGQYKKLYESQVKDNNYYAMNVDKHRHHSFNSLKADANEKVYGSVYEKKMPGGGCQLLAEKTRCAKSSADDTLENCCVHYEVMGVDYINDDDVYNGVLYIHTKGFTQGQSRSISMYFLGKSNSNSNKKKLLIKFDYEQLLKFANIKTSVDKSSGVRHTHLNYPVVRFYAGLMDFIGTHGVVKNIENVVGSAYSTKIIGDDQNNLMVGKSGRNFFKGLSGNDRFVTGSEFDIVYGGAGRDTISIEASEKS
ncbi:calcium-binding protein, partial [Endozoicomonas sp. ONNA1]|uniref:calcium-binding protein n=1 Tax=Endozoicomonas sp. ONNA1 TaxID=2828740 RepID=UPI0027D23C03